jgi:TRAP-type mannitol/chloroaromatic compound transport system substrate-binding protein
MQHLISGFVSGWLTFLLCSSVVWHLPVALAQAPAKPIVWRLQSSWPAGTLVQQSLLELTKMVEEMSGGRLKWEVMPSGTVVGPFEVLDAVHRGVIDATHTWPGYWAGKHPAAGLYAPPPGGPFGLGREEFISWLFAGGGAELYNELLQKELKLDVVALFTAVVPYWEAFGWLRKPFANLDDLRKLKFRTSGLGLEMMKNMGIAVVTLPGAEVLPALERGTIDGVEWAIPSHDILMGFHNVAKYYYMPDIRQPPSYQEVVVNKKKWEELPADLKAIVKYAGWAEIVRMTAFAVDMDSKAAEELVSKHGVQILPLPDDVLRAQVEAIDKVFETEARKNPFFARVLNSQREFAKRAVPHAQRIRPSLEVVNKHYWAK